MPKRTLSALAKPVRRLDDIYETAVGLITEKYVPDEGEFPAESAAVAWYDAIRKKAGTKSES